jgi:pseudaminic acid cytidylyltransferase
MPDQTVAIIPARGGSTRIPGKNIKMFKGKPMIARAIEAARNSGLFDRVLISTDSDEIAEIAVRYGAEYGFRRPDELSDNMTATAPVLLHALQWLRDNGAAPRYACCIYATTPLIQVSDLLAGYKLISERSCGSSFPVTSFGFPIFRALKMEADGRVTMFWPEHRLTRSQDLPEAYHDAGMFYWVNVERFMADPRLYYDDSLPIIVPRWRVQDIDTPEDWERAELTYAVLVEQGALK